jgi:DNA-binding NarL/FixJ family response regulator
MKPTRLPEPRKTRILVVDDHPLFREGVVQTVNRQRDWVCCGEIGNAIEALAAADRCKPDLVLLDLRLGMSDGLALLSDLNRGFPQLPVLVLSQCDETLYAERALHAGARGYVMKDQATEEVVVAIRAVLQGELYVSRQMGLRVLQKSLERPKQPSGSDLDSLSDRELQVLQLLGAGLTTRAIAADLYVSFKTVETHRENLKHKLGLMDAAGLIRYATSWVQTGSPPPANPRQTRPIPLPSRLVPGP